MMERKICFDKATLDNKIVQDDDDYLVMPAVIASEIVHQYEDGWAYKPAQELEKTAWTLDHRWVTILHHPETPLLMSASDIYGVVENPLFVKNLRDPKTKRPNRRGIRADIKWFKNKVPTPIIEQIKSGDLRDVSIGFTFEKDPTSGTFQGTNYDYVQRNIFLDHVAAPIEKGRCPGPICGIAFDSATNVLTFAADPEETEETIRVPAGHECKVTATITISEEEGIQALYCGEEKKVRTYLFDKSKDWTMEKAKAWVAQHKNKGADVLVAEANCDICKAIDQIGVLEASKRLMKKYGKDILYVIKAEKPKKTVDAEESTEDLLLDAKRTIESARWFFED